MRLALLSDIHGNLPALAAVVTDFTRRCVDAVANLGDGFSGPLLPEETARYLMAQRWTHISGNHERQLLTFNPKTSGPSDAYAHSQLSDASLAWIASLPPSVLLEGGVRLCHGTPASDGEYFLETVEPDRVRPATAPEIEQRLGDLSGEVIACGHTHIPRSVRTATGRLIVNPGSVGLPAYDDDRPYHHVMETGSPDARYAIVERRDGGWMAQLIAVPYDHRPMVELADQRERPDWVSALATGYLGGLPGY